MKGSFYLQIRSLQVAGYPQDVISAVTEDLHRQIKREGGLNSLQNRQHSREEYEGMKNTG